MAIVISNHEGYSAIYKANMATMEIGEKLFSIPGYDAEFAITNKDQNGVVGYVYGTDRQRRKFSDTRLETDQKLLAQDFAEGHANIVRCDDNLATLIVEMATPAQTSRYQHHETTIGNILL